MEEFVDDRLKVKIYLDTNILVDYVLGQNQMLKDSIDYLGSCPFVQVRSSHYVEFELSEVLKICYFGYVALGHHPSTCEKNLLKKRLNMNGHDYADYSEDISKKVNNDIDKLKENFHNLFEENVLHQGLTKPAKDLCLYTKLSKEDSLVTLSCIWPEDNPLRYSVILSNDTQYFKSLRDSTEEFQNVLNESALNISIPKFLHAKGIRRNDVNGQVNITKQILQIAKGVSLIDFWKQIVTSLVKEKNHDAYIGTTQNSRSRGDTAEWIYIGVDNENNTMPIVEGLLIVDKDLTTSASLSTLNEKGEMADTYVFGSKTTLPSKLDKNAIYSLKPCNPDMEVLEFARRSGNLVFDFDKVKE